MSNLVRFKFYETALKANRDKQILDESGINSFIANEQLIQSDWLLSQAVGGIQIQVFEDDLEVEHTMEDPESDFVCPKCESNHIYRDDHANSFLAFHF